MKFKTVAGGTFVTVFAVVAGHLAPHLATFVLQHGGFSVGVSVVLVLLLLGVMVAVQLRRARTPGRAVLEFTRRGIVVTAPNAAPQALAWRMISSATLRSRPVSCWRLTMKNGHLTTLYSELFTVEQWKQLSGQLDRTFRKRKIPVHVEA
jgi:hypothetical protein